MILLQRPNRTAASQWIDIAELPHHLGTGQHHLSTLYVCTKCGNPSWRRLVIEDNAIVTPFNIDRHDCAECGGYFPLVDSDFEHAKFAAPQARETLAELALRHPNILVRTYLHQYQETRHG